MLRRHRESMAPMYRVTLSARIPRAARLRFLPQRRCKSTVFDWSPHIPHEASEKAAQFEYKK